MIVPLSLFLSLSLYIYIYTGSLVWWVECSPVVRETWGSIPGRIIPKTLKWYLIPPCLILNNIRYVSRVKWSNPRKGIAPSPTPRCSSYWKGSLLVSLNYGRQLYIRLSCLRIKFDWCSTFRRPLCVVCQLLGETRQDKVELWLIKKKINCILSISSVFNLNNT